MNEFAQGGLIQIKELVIVILRAPRDLDVKAEGYRLLAGTFLGQLKSDSDGLF